MKINVDPGFDADLQLAQRAMERGWVTREGIESAILAHEKTPGSRLLQHLPLTPDQRRRLETPQVEVVPPEIAAVADDPARRFGSYILGDYLHSGGMGRVYKAWDVKLSRWVALKLLKDVGDERSEAYFDREARLAAGLSHPNIAAIYESGQATGERYIAMQFIPGETLDKRKRGDIKAVVGLVRDAARAVAYANAQGVVHRDLKPSNVMVTPKGHVFVLDFGLARPVKANTRHSSTGKAMGTPAYMSPEQARGSLVDSRSDVYGLGATLYESLTGRPPFSGPTIYDVLRRVEESSPARPRKLNPRIPADLETIVLKCLEKEPARRYETAEDLADDLDRFLNGDAIHARPAGTIYRARRGLAKRKAMAIASITSVVLAGVLGWWFFIGRPHSEQLRIGAEHLRRRESAMKLWAEARGLAMAGVDTEGIKRRAKDAREGFERAMEVREDALSLVMKARCLELEGQDGDALKALERAHALDPRNPDARLELAKALIVKYQALRGFPKESQIVNEGGVDRRPEKLPPETPEEHALRERGQALLASGEVPMALAGLTRGLLAIGRSDHKGAAEALASYTRAEPWDAQALWLEGNALHFAGDFMGAVAAFDQALRRLNKADTHLARGLSHQAAGLKDEAIADFTRAIAVDPGCAPAYNSRGLVHSVKRNHDEAIADLSKYLELKPRSSGALNNLAIARLSKGQFEDAIKDLTTAIEWDAKDAGAYMNRGNARLAIRLVDEAIADYMQSLHLEPKNPEAWHNLGVAHTEKGMLKEAIEDYTRAFELNPGNPRSITNRGYVKLQLELRDEAITDFDKAIEIDPKQPLGYTNRAAARALKGMTAEAEADYRKALEVAPPQWRMRADIKKRLETLAASRIFYEGTQLHESHRYEQAIEKYRKVVDLYPTSDEAGASAYNIACGYSLLGEKSKSLEWLEKAVAMGMDDVAHIEQDGDFAILRDEEGFKRLVERLKRK